MRDLSLNLDESVIEYSDDESDEEVTVSTFDCTINAGLFGSE